MSANNSCGDYANWKYYQLPNSKEQRIAPTQQEIIELKGQIMSLQLRIRSNEVDALMEKLARDKNPTLKDAWERYQAVLRLTQKK